MADGKVKIDTKIDETGIDKGLVSVGKKLKDGAKKVDNLAGSLAKASLVGAGVGLALKKISDTIRDLTESYKKQEKAETQLEAAARNNPLLSTASVKALKDYASELQGITVYGDEELIPFMAQLAASGRTQVEIMEIMSAATDMAASGQFSLDSAVRNLNKAYGGLSGELGEAIPEIKALTAEQLKNGGATKLMAERYKGIAAETAKTTGTSEQLANAIGDLKEEFGASFEKTLAPVRRFFTEFVSGWANAKRAARDYTEAKEAALRGEVTELGASAVASDKFIEYLAVRADYEAGLAYNSKEVNDQLLARMELLKSEYEQLRANEILAREGGRQAEKDIKNKEREKKQDLELAQYIRDAMAAREKQLELIRLTAEANGEEASETDILNAKMQSFVSLISESNGKITDGHPLAQEWLKDIRDTAEALDDQNAALALATELQQALTEAMGAITEIDDRDESEKMREQLDALDELYKQVEDSENISADKKLEIYQEYTDKRAILEKQLTEQIKEEEKARKASIRESFEANLQIAADFANQYQQSMATIAALANQAIDTDAEYKTQKLQEQYDKGKISAEEFEEKKTAIEQEAAKDRYKIAMWEWTASIATAIANTALGVTKALGQGGILGLITGGLVGAAGAAQLAMIFANKPIPPSFTTGGIMGGTSYTGDENLARINSREMILNAGQQKNLFDRINSGDLGGTNVQIYNQASNDVRATAQVNERGVQVFIRKTVAADMAQGRYNDSYQSMQNQLSGVRYT